MMIRALALALIALPAAAQDFPPPAPEGPEKPCADRTTITYRLANRYLESELALWVGQDGALMQLYGNPETGTMTILRATPNAPDNVCIVGSGEMLTLSPYETGEPA